MGIIIIVIIILAGLLGFGVEADTACEPDGGSCPVEQVAQGWEPVQVDGIDGVILPEGEADQLVAAESYWTPSVDDISLAEAAVAAEQGELQHMRQYAGFIENGDRKIYINGFADDMGIDWYSQPVFVEDGGETFFQAIYNVDTRELEMFSFNGVA